MKMDILTEEALRAAANLSEAERSKRDSRGLRGSISEELGGSSESFDSNSANLLKFHGIYQQSNRDNKSDKGAKQTIEMVRVRLPGGRLSSKQYLCLDSLATQYGYSTLRLTTRQDIQLHGVEKKYLKQTIASINENGMTTFSACGDVLRNIVLPVNPEKKQEMDILDPVAIELRSLLLPRTKAYTEIWLDESTSVEEKDELYGSMYLPRKFKIGLTLYGDNTGEIFANDLAAAAVLKQGKIEGYFLYAGGGLGKQQAGKETFVALAKSIGWVSCSDFVPVVKSILAIYRDYGDRNNRRRARLKYLLHDRGVEWFINEIAERSDIIIEKREHPATSWTKRDCMGWIRASDGTWSLGLAILCGRIEDAEGKKWKTALADVVRKFSPEIQITQEQNLVLFGFSDGDREAAQKTLEVSGIDTGYLLNPIFPGAMACPALPTCKMAVAESERVMGKILSYAERSLAEFNLLDMAPIIRVTGCTNGCARPYLAELAFVGKKQNTYTVYAGGNRAGTRLSEEIVPSVNVTELPLFLKKLFGLWSERSQKGEYFGDFVYRTGIEELRNLL